MGRVILYSSRSRLRRSSTIVLGLTERAPVTASSRHAGGGIFTRPKKLTFPIVTIGGQRVWHSLTRILYGLGLHAVRVLLSICQNDNGAEFNAKMMLTATVLE